MTGLLQRFTHMARRPAHDRPKTPPALTMMLLAMAASLVPELAAAAAGGGAEAAFQPIQTMGDSIVTFVTGAFGKTVALAALAIVGMIAFFTGRVPWSWLGGVALGCCFVFGGKQILGAMTAF